MRETHPFPAGSDLSVKQSEVLFLSQFMLGGSVKLLFGHNAGQRWLLCYVLHRGNEQTSMLTSRAKSSKSKMCYLWMWKQLPNFVIQISSILGKRDEHWGQGLGLWHKCFGLTFLCCGYNALVWWGCRHGAISVTIFRNKKRRWVRMQKTVITGKMRKEKELGSMGKQRTRLKSGA